MSKRWMTEKELLATPVGRAALAKEKRQRKAFLAPLRGKPSLTVSKKRGPSAIEESMAQQIKAAGLQAPIREYTPLPDRKFRLDFAWPWPPPRQFGLEVQGAVHRIKGRWKAESERRALLLLAGWRILEVNGDDVRSGRALKWLIKLLEKP